jgi:DNA modification methylase
MIYQGDCRDIMRLCIDAKSVQCCVTSPPYFGLRDYGMPGQLGLEKTPDEYVAQMVDVFRAVREVLTDDGVLWLNLGDSYARNGGEQGGGNRELMHLEDSQARMLRIPDGSGLKPKDLIGIPWRVAFALQADGWYLRQDIIWHKPNPMPESVTDRCTKAHEYLFLLTKSERYYCNMDAIKEPATGATPGNTRPTKSARSGASEHRTAANLHLITAAETRNRRSVWTIATRSYSGAHFATFPPALVDPCILAGSRPGDLVLDPFMGSGTTAAVAVQHGRRWVGCELNPEYIALAHERIRAAEDKALST